MVLTNEALNFAKQVAISKFNNILGCAIGSGTTPESRTQTGLFNELGRFQIVQSTLGVNNYIASFRVPINVLNGTPLTEFGLIDNLTSGGVKTRDLFNNPINKINGDELIIEFEVQTDAINGI